MSDGAQILLVDDEANIRRMLGALLRNEGFAVTEAASGNAAGTSFAEHGGTRSTHHPPPVCA